MINCSESKDGETIEGDSFVITFEYFFTIGIFEVFNITHNKTKYYLLQKKSNKSF